MALLHAATLTPSKLELLSAWLPTQPWAGDVSALEQVGAYRFDDPQGEVGLEAFLLRTGDGRLLHVPVTYRGAPLDGADGALVGITDHSTLGQRWVYDGTADPVWLLAAAIAALTGGHEAELLIDLGKGLERRDPTVRVQGSGSTDVPVPSLDDLSVSVARVVGERVGGAATVSARWEGGEAVVIGVG